MRRKVKLDPKEFDFHLIWRAIHNERQSIQREYKELEQMEPEKWGELFHDESEWQAEIERLKAEHEELLKIERQFESPE